METHDADHIDICSRTSDMYNDYGDAKGPFSPSVLQRKGRFESNNAGKHFQTAPFPVTKTRRISVERSRKHIRKYAFSKENTLMWTGPRYMYFLS